MTGKAEGEGVSKNMDTKEAWNEKDQTITVSEGNGFLYNLTLRAKVDSSPSDIYNILTDPNTVSIFRSIKECTYRRVLEEDGKGRRKLEVGHRAISRFLFIAVTFETHLHVWEDDVERTIKFQMARPGMMQKFDGCWRVEPFTQATLDAIYHPERLSAGRTQQQQQHHLAFPKLPLGPFNAAGLLGFLSGHHQHKAPEPTESLVALEQNILPRGHIPPGVKGLVRGLCAHQIRTMMEDLRKELQRRKDGSSTVIPRPVPHSQQGPAASKCRSASPSSCASSTSPSRSSSPSAPASAITGAGTAPLASISWSSCWSRHQNKDLWEAAAPIHITLRL